MSSFAQKRLRVTFTLSNGSVFAGDPNQPNNVLQLTGVRASAVITAMGAPAYPTCELTVWGMRQADMNALAALTAGGVTGVTRNVVQIEADSGNGFTTVFAGQIVTAMIDYTRAPDVALKVSGQYFYFDLLNPATPTSYTQPTPVATIISTIAGKLGCNFENNGVTAILSGPSYFPGTLIQQLNDACAHVGIDRYVEAGIAQGAVDPANPIPGQTIAICPKGQARQNLPSFNLSPSSGLQSYPISDSRLYLRAKALFNPAFRFGGPITISGSDVVLDPNFPKTLNSTANGNWMIAQMTHTLESFKFGGEWFTDMLLFPPGQEPPQP